MDNTHLCIVRKVWTVRCDASDGGSSDSRGHERRESKLHLDSTPRMRRKSSKGCSAEAETRGGVVTEGVEGVRRPEGRERIAGP